MVEDNLGDFLVLEVDGEFVGDGGEVEGDFGDACIVGAGLKNEVEVIGNGFLLDVIGSEFCSFLGERHEMFLKKIL